MRGPVCGVTSIWGGKGTRPHSCNPCESTGFITLFIIDSMLNKQQFDELMNLDFIPNSHSEADDVKHRGGISLDVTPRRLSTIELTLNPTATKAFDGSKEAYIKLYDSMIHYLRSDFKTLIEFDHDEYIFEHCKSGKLHLHAQIFIKEISNVAAMGVIYDLSEFLLKILRRKIPKNGILLDFNRIVTQPVCMQYTHAEQAERIIYWTKYIRKFL